MPAFVLLELAKVHPDFVDFLAVTMLPVIIPLPPVTYCAILMRHLTIPCQVAVHPITQSVLLIKPIYAYAVRPAVSDLPDVV